MAQLQIVGPANPEIGKAATYSIGTGFLYPGYLPYLSQNHIFAAKDVAQWGIYVLEDNGKWRLTKENYKSGDTVTYTFRTNSKTRKGIKIVVVKGDASGELIVKPRNATMPEIISVELLDAYGNKISKPLHYKDMVRAKAHCAGMFGQTIYLSLWEDDSTGAGHNTVNQFIARKATVVNAKGMAEASFPLLATYMSLAMKREDDNKKHEYYVTAEFFGKVQVASPNTNVDNIPLPDTKPKSDRNKAGTPQPGGKIDVTKYPSPKDVPKPQRPKDKPRAETPKFPGTPGAKTSQPDPKGQITRVEFRDAKGQPLTRAKYGEVIRVVVIGKGLKGKSFTLKVWEEDYWGTHDNLYEQVLPFTSDAVHHQFTLDAVMQNKGNNWEIEREVQELFAEIIMGEVTAKSGIIKVDENAAFEVESGVSAVTIGDGKGKKVKFAKVKEKAEEAVIYVTNEIATAIEVDKNGKITSYPDVGIYNGQSEYKEGDKIYCKKISSTQSAFPTFKAYIYRGNVVGEAVKKLKQDLKFNTHENAEATVLEVARHSGANNKNYGDSGPVPPNSISNLYELKYQYGVSRKRPSYRYRIVENRTKNKSNFPDIKNIAKESDSGNMAIGSRGAISIDPWKSKDLIGCIGLKAPGGGYHSACADRIKDAKNIERYKFIYHSINNYLESIIPELTGIYGRRGYTSNGEVAVPASEYKHQTKVYVLVDDLPELSQKGLFNEEDARVALRVIYDKYGEEIAAIVEKMYRLETTHFTSLQYKHCGTGGMEVFGDAPYYGWNSETYVSHPEHTPIGTWSAMEGPGLSGKGGNAQQKNKPKTFVKLPTVLAGMEYKAEYIERYDGNYARWYNATNTNAQEEYKKSLTGIIPRIVNSFKK